MLEIGKNISVFKNSFPYSADVKPTVNENQLHNVLCLHLSMLSLCVYCDLHVYFIVA